MQSVAQQKVMPDVLFTPVNRGTLPTGVWNGRPYRYPNPNPTAGSMTVE